MTISNNQVLRLKKLLINGRNQSVYQPKIYQPRELPQFLVDENEAHIEVVNPTAVIEKNPNAVSLQGEGVEVKTINTVMKKPEAPKPEAKTIEVKPAEEKVTVKRRRKTTEEA